jgi:hypothetical protein
LISFEEKKSAASGKTLPFYSDDTADILIRNFKCKMNVTAAPKSSSLHTIERSFMVFYRPGTNTPSIEHRPDDVLKLLFNTLKKNKVNTFFILVQNIARVISHR